MVSCAILILGPFWVSCLIRTCRGEELSREVVLSYLKERVLEGLGLEVLPSDTLQAPGIERHTRVPRTSRTTWVNDQNSQEQESSEIILFPSPASSCATSGPITFTYYFQPSINTQDTVVTSAHFWFYAGEGANSSAQVFIITSTQQLLQAAEAPAQSSPDGWITYHLDQTLLGSVAEGPFLLQVHCAACHCSNNEPDKTPFLHIHFHPQGPARSPRHAEAATTIPWSPSAIYLLQRPSQERPHSRDCHRAEIDISFEELGWENWIVHPKVITFYYCHGNCSAGDRTMTQLGITQCCAPVPGSMKSLKVTTTSDGGYSFKYEILPNLMPEECTCI
ncbi:inhibin alpha chain [Parambassis ranga]|uniref:Inhibin alpha chain n=1 Tax=Parambassis ranga TaxID=210632 RepID=A0A6P7JKC2_9TELE|nr:inhibin alpha chain [Parambassis ranga]XP_028277300.1 inhibin alpha chain [Parambassis ranga]